MSLPNVERHQINFIFFFFFISKEEHVTHFVFPSVQGGHFLLRLWTSLYQPLHFSYSLYKWHLTRKKIVQLRTKRHFHGNSKFRI